MVEVKVIKTFLKLYNSKKYTKFCNIFLYLSLILLIFVMSEKITVADDIKVRRAEVRLRSNSRAGRLFYKKD